MSDEHLRELERRWRSTGALADRLALLRERVRLFDAPGARHRLAVHDHDAAVARAAVTAVLERELPRIAAAYAAASAPARPAGPARKRRRQPAPTPAEAGPHARWRYDLVPELDRALTAAAGPWFEGLGRGLGMERWCACHRLLPYGEPPRVEAIPVAVSGVMAHVDDMHRVHARLLDVFDTIELPAAEPAAMAVALAAASRALVDFVVRETGCDDAWYYKPGLALRLLVQDKDLVVPEAALEAAHGAFSATFESWIEPRDEQVTGAADAASLALVQALFEERYGSA